MHDVIGKCLEHILQDKNEASLKFDLNIFWLRHAYENDVQSPSNCFV